MYVYLYMNGERKIHSHHLIPFPFLAPIGGSLREDLDWLIFIARVFDVAERTSAPSSTRLAFAGGAGGSFFPRFFFGGGGAGFLEPPCLFLGGGGGPTLANAGPAPIFAAPWPPSVGSAPFLLDS